MSLTEVKKITNRLAKAPTKKDLEAYLELKIQLFTDRLIHDEADSNKLRGAIFALESLLVDLRGERD